MTKSTAMLTILTFIFVAIALPIPMYAQPGTPKTVEGFVFLSDGFTNAPAGTFVNISVINETCTAYANISDSNETTTGGNGAPPGHDHYYQCTVSGFSGDNITVLAWNNTHYGKNDTETLNGEPGDGVTVNVTMNIPKGVDDDDDELNNFDEDYTYRTDRTDPDTDGGGENDGSEVTAGRNPLDPSDDQPPVPPPPPPVAVPEYNMIGLLALIGILSVVLAVATLRRR